MDLLQRFMLKIEIVQFSNYYYVSATRHFNQL